MIRFFSRPTVTMGFFLVSAMLMPRMSFAACTPEVTMYGAAGDYFPGADDGCAAEAPPDPAYDEHQQGLLDYLDNSTNKCIREATATKNFCEAEKRKIDATGRDIERAKTTLETEKAKEDNATSIQTATRKLNEFITKQQTALTTYLEKCPKHVTDCKTACDEAVRSAENARNYSVKEEDIVPHEVEFQGHSPYCTAHDGAITDARKLQESLGTLAGDIDKARCETAATEDCEPRAGGGRAGAAGAAGAGGGDVAGASPPADAGAYSADAGGAAGATPGAEDKKKKSGGNADFSGVLAAAAGIIGQAMNQPQTTTPTMQPAELPADHCSRPENRNELVCICQGSGGSLPQCRMGQASSESSQLMGGQITGGGGAKLETTQTGGADSLKMPNMPAIPNMPPPVDPGGGGGPANFGGGGYGGGGGGGINTGGNMRPSGPDRDDRPMGASISADILTGTRGGSGSFAPRGGSAGPRNPEGLPGYNLGLPRPSAAARPDMQKFEPDMKPPAPPPRMLAGQVGKPAAFNPRAADFKLHPASTVIWQPISLRYQALSHTLEP